MNYTYENRFAAFIDILGFKEMVAQIENKVPGHEQLYKRLISVLNFLREESIESDGNHDLLKFEMRDGALIESELGDPKITYVSDCAIVSTVATFDGFKSMCNKLTKFATDLACDGVFLRGAITYGPLFHDEKFIFGSAYQRAYDIESKISIHPRIVVDDTVLSFLVDHQNEFPFNGFGSRKDTDGLTYLHYFPWQFHPYYTSDWFNFLLRVKGHIIYSLNYFDSRTSGFPLELKELNRFYCWTDVIGTQINFSGSNKKTLDKYIWLKDEFNRTLERYADFFKNENGHARIAKIVDLDTHWGPEAILGNIR